MSEGELEDGGGTAERIMTEGVKAGESPASSSVG